MSPDLALDFARYATRPARGGWHTRCKDCDRETTHKTVDGVLAWQRAHTCSPEAEAAVTRRKAEQILATLTPDPMDVVLRRRRMMKAAFAPRRRTT